MDIEAKLKLSERQATALFKERLKLEDEVDDLKAMLGYARVAMNPRFWPAEAYVKWHRSIPNVQLAFDELRTWIGIDDKKYI